MIDPQVTIVVSPRERFSYTRESLESIYEYTQMPFKLVYVDGNSPAKVRRYLDEQAQARGFQLVRTDYYLSPNHARNLGLAHVKTKYVVFIDNDVIVSPGWLNALVQCAEETEATVVGPLMCQDAPVHEIVHFAGGESHVVVDAKGRRRLREKMYKQGQRVADVRKQLQRTQTELAEFHCVLVRTEIFERIGLLDEGIPNTKEHLDFCMSVIQAGGTVYFEPECIVTYVPGPPLEWSDLPYYMLRWSDAWTLMSLKRLQEKWDLAEDGYFKTKYRGLGWRRRNTIIQPIVRFLSFGSNNPLLERILNGIDRRLNHYLTTRYAQRQSQGMSVQTPTQGYNSGAIASSQS
ncbi:MAG: glycosyltransferase [Coleofasciculus sp. S288]|nr:glycosyltransferase [Coleofasciculus sp. S288]